MIDRAARLIAAPFRAPFRTLMRTVGVPLYRAFFFFRRTFGRLHLPGKQKLIFLLTNRYAVHGLIIFLVLATGAMSVQAETLRSEEFGRQSMLYRIATDSEVEAVQVVRADAVLSKPTKYLGSAAVSVQPNIDFDFFGEDYVATTAGGTAIIAQTISEVSESIAPRLEVITYTVQEGDTMSTIAQTHGISLTTLLWSNDLSVRSVIRPGDALRVMPVDGVEHTVKSGDTVLALARKYRADASAVVSFNKLADAGDLRIGETLIIPGGVRQVAAPAPRTNAIARIFAPPRMSTPSTATPGSSGMIWPADLRVITQYFGWSHTGLDIDCQYTNDNYAADDGIVQFSGWKGGYGLTVEVNHGNGIVTRYAHAARNYVTVGQSVSRGQPVELCGTTGRSSGTHLHFEVIVNGQFKNPLGYIE